MQILKYGISLLYAIIVFLLFYPADTDSAYLGLHQASYKIFLYLILMTVMTYGHCGIILEVSCSLWRRSPLET